MKRLIPFCGVLLLFVLAACNALPTPDTEEIPTEAAPADVEVPSEETAAPTEAAPIAEEPTAVPTIAELSLTGVTWEWLSTTTPEEEITSAAPTRYNVIFNEDGSANIQADCNRVVASYTVDDSGGLDIALGPTTLAACPPDSQDSIFTSGLENVVGYSIEEGFLLLELADGGTMRFQSVLPTEPDGGTGATMSLTGVTWQWQGTTTPEGEIASADPSLYTVIFNEDGTANIVADCNVMTAAYTTDGSSTLDIEMGISTMVACSPDSQDGMFRNNLDNAAIYFFQDGQLFIDMFADAGMMRFSAADGAATSGEAAAPSLTGVTWQWVALTTPVEETLIADPTRYTITFNEDGTANLQNDCNVGGAQYTTDGNAITITLGFTSLAACPADTQDALFSSSLTNVAVYSFDGADLLLDLFADGGTMRFQAAAAEEATGGEPGLTGVTWQWVALTTPVEETLIADPTRYTITFNEDGTAGIQADCNVGGAEYSTDDSAIAITLGVSTLVACEPGSQDTLFRDSLSNAAIYSFDGDDLLLDLFADAGTMRFVSAGEPSLTGVTWQWEGTTTPVEEITSADPTRYTIIFNEDGTANIQADCNQMTATYTTDDSGVLDITLGVSTRAACPPDSQEQVFSTGLDNAAIYFFQDGQLFIDQFASAGTMRFSAGSTTEATTDGTQPTQPGGEQTTPPLVGTSWQWVALTTPVGETAVADPSRYTISFRDGDIATVRADCNYGGGRYTASEGTIDITLTISTRAACPPDSQEQMFRESLDNAVIYFVMGGDLYLDLPFDSGTMRLTPAP